MSGGDGAVIKESATYAAFNFSGGASNTLIVRTKDELLYAGRWGGSAKTVNGDLCNYNYNSEYFNITVQKPCHITVRSASVPNQNTDLPITEEGNYTTGQTVIVANGSINSYFIAEVDVTDI